MKTPKRHHELTTMEHSCTEKVWDFSQEQVNAQRWTRKNRIKQLKRTIERYKYGTMLDGQFDLYLAYKWLQQLKMPRKKADSRSWKCYIYGLRAIRGVIVSALMESEEVLKKVLERENGKEQP